MIAGFSQITLHISLLSCKLPFYCACGTLKYMEPNGGNEFNFSGSSAPTAITSNTPPTAPQPAPMQWEASEFIDHQKNFSWFLPLIIGGGVLSFGVFFATKDILSTVVLLLGVITFGIYARQKPRTLKYSLSGTTIEIGEKSYSYDDFRSFSIMQDGALFSIVLQPIKRFLPPLTIYFAPDDGEKIFDTLASHLPHEERKQDPVESLMRKIRF